MRKRILALLLSLGVVLCGCGNTSGGSTANTEQVTEAASEGTQAQTEQELEKRKVIIDTDTGADDASALILAAKSKNIDIVGVTVLVGNVDLEQGTKNALMALEVAGSDAPVYKGAADTYTGEIKEAFSVYGQDGMGDMDLVHPKRTAESEDGIDFIINTVKENPGEIEIICLGPATNIAKAVEKDPETMKQVKMIWSMGSAGLGPGNASPVAEFNVYADAAAYKIMLDSGIPITVAGLDICDGDALWGAEQFDELKQTNEIGAFVTDSFGKLREFDRNNGSNGYSMNCDALAMMCAVSPDFVTETVACHASCITEEGETFAQVIYYRDGFVYDSGINYEPNVQLVTKADQKGFFERYKAAIR